MAQSAAVRIGELARLTGCNVETIRYYERVGLLPQPARSAARYRLYTAADIQRLRFVRRARELGFTLDDVRALLAMAGGREADTCAQVRRLAARHLADIEAKIADLRALERVLADAVERCDAGELPSCPLIDTLSGRPPSSLGQGSGRSDGDRYER